MRLPVRTGAVARLGTEWRRRFGWYPGDWMWPALVALVIAALGAGAAIWLTNDDRRGAHGTVVGTTGTQPVTQQTQPTAPEQTGTTSTSPNAKKPPPAPKPKPRPANSLTPWPPRAGWTVILASIPASSGRGSAVSQARRALRAGLKQVGVLASSRFSTLHPGYYVVFTGVYSAQGEATSASSDAHSRGYATAYPSRIAR